MDRAKADRDARIDQAWQAGRPSARQRGYTTRWEKARKHYLRAHPLCTMCQKAGCVVPANVVDHVVPHKGDPTLFWDNLNWQALCKPCHDRLKQAEELHGYISDIGNDGLPLDPNHPFYGGGGG